MIFENTSKFYGAVTKFFHWLTAALILTLIPLGIIANRWAHQIKASEGAPDPELIQNTAFLFSLHKTLGVMVFFVALMRILWAISQPKPGLLHGDRRVESWLAETVHYLLYASLVAVPLAGWVHHAASTGFAPIWWPFGQSLPFVPKSESLSHTAASLHIIFERVLVISLALHIAGALKHHFVDRDSTLLRMLPGTPAVPIVTPGHSKTIPIITAGIAYIAAMFVGAWLGMFQFSAAAQTAVLEAVETDWTVQSGTIAIDITQFGSQVSGEFKDWTAAITFDPEVRNGPAGDVVVTIAIPSLTLGSVTDQAMGADFFDADTFPTATFTAQLNALDGAYVAAGILTIKGQSLPLDFDFDLQLDGDIATVMATTDLNRLDYSVGASMPDESSLAFGVDVTINLTATQSAN